jgi:hypothetical protein
MVPILSSDIWVFRTSKPSIGHDITIQLSRKVFRPHNELAGEVDNMSHYDDSTAEFGTGMFLEWGNPSKKVIALGTCTCRLKLETNKVNDLSYTGLHT